MSRSMEFGKLCVFVVCKYIYVCVYICMDVYLFRNNFFEVPCVNITSC